MADKDDIADFQELFGLSAPPATDPPADPAVETPPVTDPADPAGTPPPATDPGTPATADPQTPPASTDPEVPPTKQEPGQKQSDAFAAMRVENSKLKKTVSQFAAIMKLDPNAPTEQLIANMQNILTNVQAKQANVPPDMLARLNQLEEINNNYQSQRLLSKSQTELIEIAEQYRIPKADLDMFLNELVADDMNPLEKEVDLKLEYVKRNWQKVVKQAADDAVAAEQARAAAAAGASNPNGSKGAAPPSDPKPISTVEGLDTYLNSQLPPKK